MDRRRFLVATASTSSALSIGYFHNLADAVSQGDNSMNPSTGSHEFPALPFLDTAIRERYLAGINGLTVHVLEAGFETPDRPAVLLLHGFPDLAYCWRNVMVPLADAGYHVIAPDQRGYGRTTGWDNDYDADVDSFRNHNYARDAIGIAMAMGHREVACVVGHDFGAAVAAYCVLARPDVFRSLILMSFPFDGVPPLPFNTSAAPPAGPSPAQQLAALPRPRKDSMVYFSTREANHDMVYCKQGVSDFLRAYFYVKSADHVENQPYALASSAATELAKMPTYYIMDIHKTMPETVASHMPSAQKIAEERWLTNGELSVYAQAFERTGFQGSLNWFRCNTSGTNAAEMGLFAGRTIDVPSCFIAGAADWGIFRKPGALEAMHTKACTQMGEPQLIDGAGHWVQQEKAAETSDRMIAFLHALRT
jgi:pimeloyl-ACP methyl ester carboxylesterase